MITVRPKGPTPDRRPRLTPFWRRALTVALAAAKLGWVAQPGRARIGEGLLL